MTTNMRGLAWGPDEPVPAPLHLDNNPVDTLRALHAHALEMAAHYHNQENPLWFAHWTGHAMAYALVLRDGYHAADADALIEQIPLIDFLS